MLLLGTCVNEGLQALFLSQDVHECQDLVLLHYLQRWGLYGGSWNQEQIIDLLRERDDIFIIIIISTLPQIDTNTPYKTLSGAEYAPKYIKI